MPHKISPDDWTPQGNDIEGLEDNADWAVRSMTHSAITAGPGAGKTELLVQRACYLLQTGKCAFPHQILALTYKRDAANSLRDRVSERCHDELARRLKSSTYHSFALQLLYQGREALPPWCSFQGDIDPIFKLSNIIEEEFNIGEDLASKVENSVLKQIPQNGFRSNNYLDKFSKKWWEYCLSKRPCTLSFGMITRLADLLVRLNSDFRNAIRSTYAFVFLDEFQDTTLPQYDLVSNIFSSSSSILTAVGDQKQHIMGFAGALPDSFERFQEEYNAEQRSLKLNYRSSPDLVAIQKVLIQDVAPEESSYTSGIENEIEEEACEIVTCKTPSQEAYCIAEEIARCKENQDLTGNQFAIIVRQNTDSFVPKLKHEFGKRDMKLRDDHEIQDLLSEPLTDILITFLRLSGTEHPPSLWSEAMEIVSALRGLRGSDFAEPRALAKELDHFIQELQEEMDQTPPLQANPVGIIDKIIGFLGKKRIQGEYRKYREKEQLDYWIKRFTDYFAQVNKSNQDWHRALDELEGVDSTPVMTVHKSKGLEYHTVFLMGLEDGSWWTIKEEPDGTRRQFLVGFSRAKHRVVITNCSRRSNTNDVSPLYDLLKEAGVNTRSVGDFLSYYS